MKFGRPRILDFSILRRKGYLKAFWKEGRLQRKALRKGKAMWVDIKGFRRLPDRQRSEWVCM